MYVPLEMSHKAATTANMTHLLSSYNNTWHSLPMQNPYDNVAHLAHLFFKRCLDAGITPYIVTKKTVFKWQEGFWKTMKEIFDKDYKEQFVSKGLLERSGGDLQHLISDAATMQLIRWTDGGFGMAAHNYDGDMCKFFVSSCRTVSSWRSNADIFPSSSSSSSSFQTLQ